MLSPQHVIIISDLHLATERDKGLFQADLELAAFLHWVRKSFNRCYVVLNGDSFDFLAGTSEEAINLDGLAGQAATIAENHKEVFEVLGDIAKSKEHQLIILGGNHDPELALSSVQREIENQLMTSSPQSSIRWLTNGEAALLRVGDARVLIEHGDQYDSWNWIDHEALRRVVCLASRNVSYEGVYSAPPGSRLVINRFNSIRDRFRWLETLQPFSPSILPLALEVILPSLADNERDQLLGSIKEFRSFSRRSVSDVVLSGLGSKSTYWAGDDVERQLLSEWLAQYEREEHVWSGVDDIKAAFARMVARLRGLSARALLKRASKRDSFFKIEEPDGQYGRVAKLIEKGVDLVLHGHTHAAKAYGVTKGLYLNTGTWAQLTKLPDGESTAEDWITFVETLRANSAASFPRATFAQVSAEESTKATLSGWNNNLPEPQSSWCFENGGWRKE